MPPAKMFRSAIPIRSKSAPIPTLADGSSDTIPSSSSYAKIDRKAHVKRADSIVELEKKLDKSKRNCKKYTKRIEEYEAYLDDFTSRIASLENEFFSSIRQCDNLIDTLVSANHNADKRLLAQEKKIEFLEAQGVAKSQVDPTIKCGEDDFDFTELLARLDICINVMEQKEPQAAARCEEIEHRKVQAEAQETVIDEEFAKIIKKKEQSTKQRPKTPLVDDAKLYTYQADSPIFAGRVWSVMTVIVVYIYSANF